MVLQQQAVQHMQKGAAGTDMMLEPLLEESFPDFFFFFFFCSTSLYDSRARERRRQIDEQKAIALKLQNQVTVLVFWQNPCIYKYEMFMYTTYIQNGSNPRCRKCSFCYSTYIFPDPSRKSSNLPHSRLRFPASLNLGVGVQAVMPVNISTKSARADVAYTSQLCFLFFLIFYCWHCSTFPQDRTMQRLKIIILRFGTSKVHLKNEYSHVQGQ